MSAPSTSPPADPVSLFQVAAAHLHQRSDEHSSKQSWLSETRPARTKPSESWS